MLSSHHQQHSYRAALSLNNAGASLLERGLYREAYKTLTESLLLVKQVFQGEQQEHKSLHQEQPVMDEPQSLTDSFLRSAAVRLAGVPLKEERASSVVADVTIVEDADWCALRRAAVYGPSTSVVFAVRISEENFESITQHFGVLLYNHGLAAFLLNRQLLLEKQDKNSNASSSSKKARSYLAKAQASWQMAHRTLDSVLQTTTEEEEDDTSAADTSNQVQIILLSALVLHALSMVYRQQKNLAQAREAQALGHALCQDLEDDGYCQQMLLISSSTHTAAAA